MSWLVVPLLDDDVDDDDRAVDLRFFPMFALLMVEFKKYPIEVKASK